MIQVTEKISIPENELKFEFIRASGPGGQNVNKVATAVQLRFDVENSPSLPENVRERLLKIARNRINEKGELIIKAQRYRSQQRNRKDAIDRLIALIQKAAIKPKPRILKKPSPEAKKRRLEEKRRRSEIKRLRQKVTDLED